MRGGRADVQMIVDMVCLAAYVRRPLCRTVRRLMIIGGAGG